MSVDVYNSTLLAGTGRAFTIDRMSKLRFIHFNIAAPAVAGDDGSSAILVKLPQGRVRVFPHLSKIWSGAFGAARVLATGHDAYAKSDGTTEAANLSAFGSAVSLATAVTEGKVGTARKYDVFSRDGVNVRGTVTGGTWPVTTGTLEGYIAYAAD